MVNKVILVGRLATDPDVKAAASGTHIAKFRLVTNSYAGKDVSISCFSASTWVSGAS